jgi:hypothetical protein
MRAWQAAIDLVRSNRTSALADRSSHQANDGDLMLHWLAGRAQSYIFDDHVCFFCHEGGQKMTTGVLPVVGAIWKCSGCQVKYNDLKKG